MDKGRRSKALLSELVKDRFLYTLQLVEVGKLSIHVRKNKKKNLFLFLIIMVSTISHICIYSIHI